MEIEHVLPADIEKNSFDTITKELALMGISIPSEREAVVKRVIHTTADFEYADTLCFSDNGIQRMKEALRRGAHIVTDTNMAMAGINKKTLAVFGGTVHCFMADGDVAAEAKSRQCTRASVCMEKAAGLGVPVVFAVGNAPTALLSLCSLMDQGFQPAGIIGVPVGFVNVAASKELIMEHDVAYIVNRGRKGGSNVAAAVCNALLYELDKSRGGSV